MIRKLFFAAGVTTLALVTVGSLTSARMATTQLIATEGRGAAQVESISNGNLAGGLENVRLLQPGRIPMIALGK